MKGSRHVKERCPFCGGKGLRVKPFSPLLDARCESCGRDYTSWPHRVVHPRNRTIHSIRRDRSHVG